MEKYKTHPKPTKWNKRAGLTNHLVLMDDFLGKYVWNRILSRVEFYPPRKQKAAWVENLCDGHNTLTSAYALALQHALRDFPSNRGY